MAKKGISGFPVGILLVFATGGIWEGVVLGAAPTGSPKSGFKKIFEKIL